MTRREQLGVLGLGLMGGGVARSLLREGWEVLAYDLSDVALQRVTDKGGRVASSAADLARRVDILLTSLPRPSDVRSVYLDRDGLVEHLRPGALAIDLSTVDPATSRHVHDGLAERGVHFLACPLGKGPAQAESGQLPLFVGGRADLLERARPVFNTIGERVHHLGDVEQAAAFKLISNLMGMTSVVVMAEGLLLAERAGIASDVLLEALADTGGHSYQVAVRGPLLVQRDFAPRFPVSLALKDLRLALQTADEVDAVTPLGALALQLFRAAANAGLAGEDAVSVAKVIEQLWGIRRTSPPSQSATTRRDQ